MEKKGHNYPKKLVRNKWTIEEAKQQNNIKKLF